MPSPPILNQIP